MTVADRNSRATSRAMLWVLLGFLAVEGFAGLAGRCSLAEWHPRFQEGSVEEQLEAALILANRGVMTEAELASMLDAERLRLAELAMTPAITRSQGRKRQSEFLRRLPDSAFKSRLRLFFTKQYVARKPLTLAELRGYFEGLAEAPSSASRGEDSALPGSRREPEATGPPPLQDGYNPPP